MKKTIKLLLILMIATLVIAGCEKKEKNLDMSVSEVIEKVYEGLKEDEDIPKTGTIELNEENLSYYLGIEELDMEEGIASEPLMNAIPHSVVVVKVKDVVDIEQTKKDIKEKINPAKWMCVEAENVIVESKGNIIILIMTDEEATDVANKIQENFNNLK